MFQQIQHCPRYPDVLRALYPLYADNLNREAICYTGDVYLCPILIYLSYHQILYQGLKASTMEIITIVLGFLVRSSRISESKTEL